MKRKLYERNKGKKEKRLLETQEPPKPTQQHTPNPPRLTKTQRRLGGDHGLYKECAKDESKKNHRHLGYGLHRLRWRSRRLRTFMKAFEDMPENILVAIAYSMSKSYLIYGMRSGALACLTSAKHVADEFEQVNTYSNRATWSNGSRGAQRLLAEIVKDPALKKQIDEERLQYKEMLEKRAAIFVKKLGKSASIFCLISQGFFITLPAKDSAGLAEKLAEDNIFVIPRESNPFCHQCSTDFPGAGFSKEGQGRICRARSVTPANRF